MKHMVIIDGLNFLFRAYHAVRPLTRSDGLHTNALYGFAQMLIKVVTDLKPDYCAVALDSREEKTFREQIYPAYKAHRKEMDTEMAEQLPYFEPLVEAFGIPGLRVEGFEADDIIATLATRHGAALKVTILSSDKDLMQLIGGGVTMLDTMKNRKIGAAEVVEKFGVGPEKVIEVQSLIGDSSDNIPGVPGIGPKTAAQLIGEFGSLESLYQNLDKVQRDKLRENLRENEEKARLSHELVTLKRDVPVSAGLEALTFHPDLSGARGFLLELEFRTLAVRLAAPGGELKKKEDITYETVTRLAQLEPWIAKISDQGWCVVDTETTSLNPMRAELVGISLAVAPGEACYIPLAHTTGSEGMLDFTATGEALEQIPKKEALKKLAIILENPEIRVIGHNIKYDMLVLENAGIRLPNVEDSMVMSACLDAGRHPHNLDALALLHLNHRMIAFKDVCGSGKNQITFDRVPLAAATRYAAEDADITLRLFTLFSGRLRGTRLEDVYRNIEKPLIPVLAAMERRGVRVDRAQLEKLSLAFANRMARHEKRVHALAGQTFNVNSTKQLGEVLFDALGLEMPGGKKKKRSTNVEVMEELAAQGHEIAAEVLAYRQVAKLRSTYTEALIEQINPKTGRVHTSYNQVGAATGRLSSSDPNLQNIPVRTEDGRKIRHAFIPEKGRQFLSADYSQVELRLLAHVAEVEELRRAFREGKDIHAHTAHQIFGVPEEEVDAEKRRVAKIINFGIVYGMGAFSLARQLGVPNKVAQEYIGNYFNRYQGVREYMDKTITFAHEHGYVETPWGRRIHVPNINAKQPMLKAGAERAAINAPLQGANADIIKMVMPKLEARFQREQLPATMLMQVHDELIFEVEKAAVDKVAAVVREEMENVVSLSIPLKVGIACGDNWESAH